MSDICLGIDLGTTYSCVAYVDDATEKAVTLRNCEGQLTTPSAVYFEEKDNIVIGDEAKTYAVTEPDKTVTFIKREMGSDFKREIFDTEYTPQEVSAIILKKIVKDANSALLDLGVIKEGEVVNKAVITCPAYFGMAQKEATKMAGEMAGIEVLDIINEPTAAAINYGMLHKENGTCLVYDLGGGTFDVTIIKIEKNNIEVVCTGGEPTLGGKDWDMASVQYFVEQWKEQMKTDEDISEDLETDCELMAAAEKAKKSLSVKEKTPININYDGQKLKMEYTRRKFEEITAHLLKQTISLTKDCIAAAEEKGVPASSIGNILLVGGSSKMPQVEEALKKEFPAANVYLCDPDEGVAKGAALYAKSKGVEIKVLEDVVQKTGKTEAELSQELNEGKTLCSVAEENGVSTDGIMGGLSAVHISNVSSRTYGIAVIGDNNEEMIENFIFQNDKTPKKITKHFGTHEDMQSGVSLDIYESNVSDAFITNMSLAKIVTKNAMKLKQPVPKGTGITVTMLLENSGLMKIHAVEDLNKTELDVSIDINTGYSQKEREAATERTLKACVN